MPRRPAAVFSVLSVLVLAVVAVLVPLPAQAASTSYVALGDSFASGVGSRTYSNDGTQCYRSPKSYPAVVAGGTSLALTLAACSGATTSDVINSQLGLINSSVSLVSLTVGGNDAGFATVITECAKPSWWGDCYGAINRGLSVVQGPLPGRIDAILASIRSRAPSARVVITGYPRLFNGSDCNLLTFFSGEEMRRLNEATLQLNSVLRARALAYGVQFVDPAPSFQGHAWCDPVEWINGLSNPTVNSYHPNVAGHAEYGRLVRQALIGTSPLRTSAAPAVRLPNVRSANGPAVVRAPDLSSREAREAARRAGISDQQLQRLQAAQRAAER